MDLEGPLPVRSWAKHSHLHYGVRVERRDSVPGYLWERGVETRVLYPKILHKLRYYAWRFPHRARNRCERSAHQPRCVKLAAPSVDERQ